MTEAGYPRRVVLGAGVLGAGLFGLAGCSCSKGGGGATTSAGSTLVKLSDVPVGGSVAATAKVDGHPVVVSHKSAGAVAAFSAICTHMGWTVNAGGVDGDSGEGRRRRRRHQLTLVRAIAYLQ